MRHFYLREMFHFERFDCTVSSSSFLYDTCILAPISRHSHSGNGSLGAMRSYFFIRQVAGINKMGSRSSASLGGLLGSLAPVLAFLALRPLQCLFPLQSILLAPHLTVELPTREWVGVLLVVE